MTTPSDQAARKAIVERLDENMVVEAGAGTGKTTSLVERIVALITTEKARSIGGIAAITFTEAAAAELRSRIGERLERVGSDPNRQQAERERCNRAVADLDQASIQTLHSFAGSLLRERPLEAGLPPGFGIRDEIESEVAFEKYWSDWLDTTLDDPEGQEVLRPALAEGMTLRQIREIALRFHRNYDLLPINPFRLICMIVEEEDASPGAELRPLSAFPQLHEAHKPFQDRLVDVRSAVLAPVLELLRRFALDYAAERKAAGEVEFQDLLVLARDLLRDSLDDRDHFRERYSRILIDEVQDTDPLQAELAMFLAEHVPDGADTADRPRVWRDVRPQAGKLFIVGDPKQSIYRFRRADIQQVGQLQEAVGGSKVVLTRNFRSLPPVIKWVNHVFPQWMAEGAEQPGYSPLEAKSEHSDPPAVRHMGGALGGNVAEVRRQEAEAIRRTIETVVTEGWPVRREDGARKPPTARYHDICVLAPSRLGFDELESAFETAGIPYRLESASLVYQTQEARDLLNCISAIDDPTDQVSVVAALRSPAFACSDEDLLHFVEAGGQFDYLADESSTTGNVPAGLAVLKEFHERRRWTSPAALIEEFVRNRRVMELALDNRQWRPRWSRYRFLIDRARAFAASGETSLRAYINWTIRQRDKQARAQETAVPESDEDAVRVMTVHAAKGLEFPILILAGLNAGQSQRAEPVRFNRDSGKVEVKVGPKDLVFRTGGYEELAAYDKEREEEEDVRLMYVAATRARDHLIVSLYRNSRGKNSAAARIEEFMAGAGHLWQKFVPPAPEDLSDPGKQDGYSDPDVDTPAMRRQWQDARREVYAARSLPTSAAATTLAKEAKDEQDVQDEPWRRGRAGTSIGRAVHAVLQVVDLKTGDGLADIASAQAAAEGLPGRADDIARLARRALDSPLVHRALESGRWWRETPVAGPVGDGIVEGFIDLLFEEEDGYVVVDYKTDAVRTDEDIDRAMGRYRLQGGSYALALSKATGLNVKEVSFLFLEPRREVAVEDLPGAMLEAEQVATALFKGETASTL